MAKNSQIIIILSCVLAIISLFAPWASAFTIKNGFSLDGYIFLLLFLYPCIASILNKNLNKAVSYIPSIIGIVLSSGFLYYIKNETFNDPAVGIYLMILAFIILLIGVLMNQSAVVKSS